MDNIRPYEFYVGNFIISWISYFGFSSKFTQFFIYYFYLQVVYLILNYFISLISFMARRTVFNTSWLEEPTLKSWLQRVEGDQSAAYCKLCHSSIQLGNMGKRALQNHMKTKKRQTFASAMGTSSLSSWVQ